ncbi:hypothetical protein PIPA1_38160 [Pelosinus sp. IPA-1]|nr:hypothetical protein PIPA1_38160 [Pelosinus sp. IPA-1]
MFKKVGCRNVTSPFSNIDSFWIVTHNTSKGYALSGVTIVIIASYLTGKLKLGHLVGIERPQSLR